MEKNKAFIAEKAIETDKHEKESQKQNGAFTSIRINLEIKASQFDDFDDFKKSLAQRYVSWKEHNRLVLKKIRIQEMK